MRPYRRHLALTLTLCLSTLAIAAQQPGVTAQQPDLTKLHLAPLQQRAERRRRQRGKPQLRLPSSSMDRASPRTTRRRSSWYRKAADQGYAPAQNSLGAMYRDGQGVNQTMRKALFWYRKAATKAMSSRS